MTGQHPKRRIELRSIGGNFTCTPRKSCATSTETWRAFELTVVESQSIEAAAVELNKPVGTIYAARVDVEVSGERFPVVGFGGVIVAAAHRGRGLAREILQAALARARELGPAFVILFCREDRAGLYYRLGFADVEGPVIVEQPSGEVEMPLRMMWRGLADEAHWPPGPVVLRSLPF